MKICQSIVYWIRNIINSSLYSYWVSLYIAYQISTVDLRDLDPMVEVHFKRLMRTRVNHLKRVVLSLWRLATWQPVYGLGQSLAKTTYHLRPAQNFLVLNLKTYTPAYITPFQSGFIALFAFLLFFVYLMTMRFTLKNPFTKLKYYQISPITLLGLFDHIHTLFFVFHLFNKNTKHKGKPFFAKLKIYVFSFIISSGLAIVVICIGPRAIIIALL